jgi:hypothetical protein
MFQVIFVVAYITLHRGCVYKLTGTEHPGHRDAVAVPKFRVSKLRDQPPVAEAALKIPIIPSVLDVAAYCSAELMQGGIYLARV